MDTAEESICCQANSAVSINMEDGGIPCITKHDIFVDNCLNRKKNFGCTEKKISNKVI
jgi:hypothetical protein